jgi:hypothetical protein
MRSFAFAPAPAPGRLAKRPMAVLPSQMFGCDWRSSECWPGLPLIKHRGFASTTAPHQPGPPVHHTSHPCQLSQSISSKFNCSTFNGPVAAGTAGTADWGLIGQSDYHPPSLCLLSMGSLPERTSPRSQLPGAGGRPPIGQVWTRAK